MTRFPGGIGGKSFFQKHWEPAPPFARTVRIHASHNDRDGDYLICENLATLLWLGQMAGLELLDVLIGDKAAAVALLDRILHSPNYVSRAWLGIDERFAPLRGYPPFDRLVAGT